MYHFIEILFTRLLKKKIIMLSSFEDSFFLYKKLDKKIKLTDDIIELNYAKESPYHYSTQVITSVIDGNNLYLWFQKSEVSLRFVPESLVLFRKLSSEGNNKIYIFKGAKQKVLIIKDKLLVASFLKREVSSNDISLMQNEYFVDDVEFFEEDEYQKSLDNGLKFLTYNDLLNILNIKINIKEWFNRFIQDSALAFLIASILLVVTIGGYDFYKQDLNEKLLHTYKNTSNTIVEMKENINKNEELNQVFTALKKEFYYMDKSMIISQILETTAEMNMTMEFIRIDTINVSFVVVTKDEGKIPIFTTKLFESKLFDDIKNTSSQKIRKVWTKATMQAQLKRR